MLGSILQQKIIDEEVLGLEKPERESKEASEFRAAIRRHIDRGPKRDKKITKLRIGILITLQNFQIFNAYPSIFGI